MTTCNFRPPAFSLQPPACFLILIIALSTAHAATVDWPQFRGPGGQGHSTAQQLPATWSETENIRWKAPVAGLGWSSPAIYGEQIWLTTAADRDQSLRAICIQRDTGEVLHDIEVFRKSDLGRIAAKNSHASPTAVLDGSHVFVHFGAHGTACLTTDGKVVWTRELQYDQRHGPGGSPVVWKDLLIVSCDGPDVQYTIALDKRTGQVRWKADHPGKQAYCTPLVIKVNGNDQLITSGGEAAIAYSPQDGKELWRCRHAGHSVVPRPVAGNGLVYFCTGYWTPALFAVRPDGNSDVTDSKIEFTVRRGVPHTPSPLLVEHRLYMVSDLGIVTCVDAEKGDEIWRHRLAGNFSASPTLADGKIYLLNEQGSMYVLAPGDQFRLLATNHLDGRTLATPAFVGQAIYLRSDTHLYRIEAPRTLQAGAINSRRNSGTLLR
ncbi:MAG TPA: PQQ-binding-like beta-propeller repeat protein [Pirellulales bacterium]|nr:PQQ-binding-like beta-propeller repeat protein [Pirellulales bacterium]